eukprot:4760949-Prymnesium_polylepis.1
MPFAAPRSAGPKPPPTARETEGARFHAVARGVRGPPRDTTGAFLVRWRRRLGGVRTSPTPPSS